MNNKLLHQSGYVVLVGLLIETEISFLYPDHESWIINGAVILANIFIWMGVWGEVHFGNKISKSAEKEKHVSDEKIAEANKRAEEAKADTARILEYAEQLRADNIALQAGVRPRRFSFFGWTANPTRVEKIYDELKKYAGTIALIQSVPDFESQMFARDIASELERQGWTPKLVSEKDSHMSDISFPEGLFIFTLSDGKTQTQAGTALCSAMTDSAHEMGSQPFDGSPMHEILTESKLGYPSFDSPITGIFIRVGLRQLSSHFLEIQKREILRQDKDWDNKQIDFVKAGGKLSLPATDGSYVEVKIGADGKLESADPSKQSSVPDRSLTLVMPSIKIRSSPPRE